jgi:hypothetical protein
VPELLQLAGDSHVKQCSACYAAGMLHLCDGDRVAASDAFRRAYDTYRLTCFEQDLLQLYLNRLEDDPDWPYGQKPNR